MAYPSLYASEVVRGAQVLATITNDGWYGDSAAPRQHLALAILRAAEARRYLVRAANTGISAVIDPYGRVLTQLGFDREGVITAEVRAGEGNDARGRVLGMAARRRRASGRRCYHSRGPASETLGKWFESVRRRPWKVTDAGRCGGPSTAGARHAGERAGVPLTPSACRAS